MKGRFITLEGIDGAGKSSAMYYMSQLIAERGIKFVTTREPGGTELGENIRALLLQRAMRAETEALLLYAARSEHIHTVILPALEQGLWVLCDRFIDASYAYQGGGRGLSNTFLKQLEDLVAKSLQPDLTLLFDLPVKIAAKRVAQNNNERDRIEQENDDFFERVRQEYLNRARAEPNRFLLVNAENTAEEIQNLLRDIII